MKRIPSRSDGPRTLALPLPRLPALVAAPLPRPAGVEVRA
jgi:hypothetical protein